MEITICSRSLSGAWVNQVKNWLVIVGRVNYTTRVDINWEESQWCHYESCHQFSMDWVNFFIAFVSTSCAGKGLVWSIQMCNYERRWQHILSTFIANTCHGVIWLIFHPCGMLIHFRRQKCMVSWIILSSVEDKWSPFVTSKSKDELCFLFYTDNVKLSRFNKSVL